MRKYLLLKGSAGLGNRLYTLSAAIEYSYRTNRHLIVDWRDGTYAPKGMNAFDLMFKLNNVNHINIKEIEKLNISSVYPRAFDIKSESIYSQFLSYNNHSLRRVPTRFLPVGSFRKIKGGWTLRKEKKVVSNNQGFYSLFTKNDFPFGGDLSLKRKEDIVIYADYCPNFDPATLRQKLILQPEVAILVEKIEQEMCLQDAIGIHIRNTDMKPNRAIGDFINLIANQQPKSLIFLSTDDSDVELNFKSRFKNLRTLPKDFKLNTSSGLHNGVSDINKKQMYLNSVLDMWLLSKCKTLFYQKHSSFSTISKFLSNSNQIYDWQDFKFEDLQNVIL
jgi:hypothetical protein